MMIQPVDDEAREPGAAADTTFNDGVEPANRRVKGVAGTEQAFLAAGTRLHEYQIEKVLGHGGFGITYLARDTMLDKPVAIKEYLPAHLAMRDHTHVTVRSPSEQRAFDWGRKQFLKEAQTLARFSHPNLVQVHRYFQANHTAYFVMAYIEGETLASRLKVDSQPSEEFLRSVLLPVMNGLKSVHRAGFLHRDIKPENLLLQKDGTPVLIDFGAARVNLDSVTRSTICALTAGYAPLEQYGSAGHQGPWTDIYALGAVAYRAVSGRKPPEAVNRIHDDALVPARLLGQGHYTTSFLEAIDWSLALHPEDRPRSIADLQKALIGNMRRERTQQPPTVTPANPARAPAPEREAPAPERLTVVSFPWATAVLPVFALGIVGFMLYAGLRHKPEAAAETPAVTLPVAAPPAQLPVAASAAPLPVAAPQTAAKAARKLVLARAAPAQAAAGPAAAPAKAVAEMESLADFSDCANCPSMTVLSGGRFSMGEPDGKGVSSTETPRHEVLLRRPFAIGRHEVTAGQYRECVRDGACGAAQAFGTINTPVVNVSFGDAQAYAAWLSRKSGRRYRLPSEAEWEYAARSGTQVARFWGADATRACSYANGAESATCRDGIVTLAAVGSFKPNWFDLYDMTGNVWEWTADCWRDTYAGAPADGRAVNVPACARHATRGGSWRTPPEALRSTLRTPVATGHRSDTLGFRVVAE